MMGKVIMSGIVPQLVAPAGLPSGYTRLAYIQSSGTQYIDTGFSPSESSRIIFDFQSTGSSNDSIKAMFGARLNNDTKCFDMFALPATVYPQYGANAYNAKPITVDILQRTVYDMNRNTATVNGASVSFSAETFDTGFSIYLFTLNDNGAADDRPISGKLYSCKIYDNGTLVRNFVPCVNDLGEVGLYDAVGKQFYGNVGTGAFIASSPVVSALRLASIAEGSVVKLNEGGSPVEFYVAKHDYEAVLNGAGRTLLVRKDCYDKRSWSNVSYNTYLSSAINSWLNGAYKALFDADVQNAIGATTFYYTPGNGDKTVTTLARSVFLLSRTETGGAGVYNANEEGSALPTASVLKTALLNGSAADWWTRTPDKSTSDDVFHATKSGGFVSIVCTASYGSRPCFTLPGTALFDESTLLFKGVS